MEDYLKELELILSSLGKEALSANWQNTYQGPCEDSEHCNNLQTSLEATREYFDSSGPQKMHSVHVGDLTIALLGTSPTSEMRARYIAMLTPSNIRLIIEKLRFYQAQELELKERGLL